ncbi:hypothetical protein JYT93_00560 [bacterium AH-315-J19]|nr:hypothetical protein [Robiginitomaculum sp.]MBN4058506.1 hypothetical protein [bacterium AH-315-J19]
MIDKPKHTGVVKRKRSIAAHPAFYLVYLLFYVVPWFFQAPTLTDIIVFVVALLFFLPLHFIAFNKPSSKFVGVIIMTQAIGLIIAPFHGMAGVFHIYASVQAGFQRPVKRAGILIALLALSFLLLSLFIRESWFEIAMVLFIGAVIGISCMASAEEMEHLEYLERTSVLDKQRAALEERERIAADLHDLLGHTLTMVALKSEVADKFLDTDIERARLEIREIRNEARAALSDVRQAVSGMSATTIKAEVERAKQALQAAGIDFKITGKLPDVNTHQDKVLGLAIREAVTNIVRHSKAQNAVLTFVQGENGLDISIKDDGIGGNFTPGAGLTGLRRRIESLGGHVEIQVNKGAYIKLFAPKAIS